MKHIIKNIAFLLVLVTLISCQTEEDHIQQGYWVENDAENSLVKFSPEGKFINVRNPGSNIEYKIEGGQIVFSSDKEEIILDIKKASDMELVFGNKNEDFTFFRANPSDYFYGIWQGTGESKDIELSFAKRNNGYLTVSKDTAKHSEPFTYQVVESHLIIYKQDKETDTLIYDFKDGLKKLELINENSSRIVLKRKYY